MLKFERVLEKILIWSIPKYCLHPRSVNIQHQKTSIHSCGKSRIRLTWVYYVGMQNWVEKEMINHTHTKIHIRQVQHASYFGCFFSRVLLCLPGWWPNHRNGWNGSWFFNFIYSVQKADPPHLPAGSSEGSITKQFLGTLIDSEASVKRQPSSERYVLFS